MDFVPFGCVLLLLLLCLAHECASANPDGSASSSSPAADNGNCSFTQRKMDTATFFVEDEHGHEQKQFQLSVSQTYAEGVSGRVSLNKILFIYPNILIYRYNSFYLLGYISLYFFWNFFGKILNCRKNIVNLPKVYNILKA
jgi:hypothetical protein